MWDYSAIVNANEMAVGVLIDNRRYGIRFVEGSFINRQCRDREIEYVMGSSVSVDLYSTQVSIQLIVYTTIQYIQSERRILKLREELSVTHVIFPRY